MDPIIGQIILFSGNFAPRGWALCDGSLLSISTNDALYSILGTTYGGDGKTTFALPDLRGRVPMGAGNGPGLTPRTLGQAAGTETHALTGDNVPPHTHPFLAAAGPGTQSTAAGASLGTFGTSAPPNGPYTTEAPSVAMAEGSIGANTGEAGGDIPLVQPSLSLNYIIATVGIYPSRA